MTNFNQPLAVALFDAMTSAAQATGQFARVNSHDPEVTPGRDISCTITLADISADPNRSSLNEVTGVITFTARLWNNAMQKPLDAIDPAMLTATSSLLGAYAGGFTLGGTVRNVDLMKLRAVTGYVNHEEKEMRVVEITVPVVVNDLWAEVA